MAQPKMTLQMRRHRLPEEWAWWGVYWLLPRFGRLSGIGMCSTAMQVVYTQTGKSDIFMVIISDTAYVGGCCRNRERAHDLTISSRFCRYKPSVVGMMWQTMCQFQVRKLCASRIAVNISIRCTVITTKDPTPLPNQPCSPDMVRQFPFFSIWHTINPADFDCRKAWYRELVGANVFQVRCKLREWPNVRRPRVVRVVLSFIVIYDTSFNPFFLWWYRDLSSFMLPSAILIPDSSVLK